MGFGRYLADRACALALCACGVVSGGVVAGACGLGASATLLSSGLSAAFIALAFSCDYLRRRRFFAELSRALEQLDESYLACELVERPPFAEGELLYDALRQATKAMCDEVGLARRAEAEHRDYVEAWIHEVKTPIAAGHLIAANDPAPAALRMDRELARVEDYVEQALYFARGNALENDYLVRELSLEDVVRDALRARARLLIDAGMTPEFGELSFTVHADPKWLGFVLGQLLSNAAKYRRPGPAGGHLVFRACAHSTGLDAERVELHVRDDGIGICAADLPRVFDKGFTGATGRVHARSTGMGLYLCRRLCDKMGIGLRIDSVQGAYTQVTLAFSELRG